MVQTPMTLDELLNGQKAEIIDCEGNDALACRLLEMGLVPGEIVSRTGQAPLGDPLEFLIQGTRISLRKQEANRIRIQLHDRRV